jgi:hypothetical protein
MGISKLWSKIQEIQMKPKQLEFKSMVDFETWEIFPESPFSKFKASISSLKLRSYYTSIRKQGAFLKFFAFFFGEYFFSGPTVSGIPPLDPRSSQTNCPFPTDTGASEQADYSDRIVQGGMPLEAARKLWVL